MSFFAGQPRDAAKGIIPVVPNASDPPINNMGLAVRRHFIDDPNMRVGLSTPGNHLQADGGQGRVHYREARGAGARPEGTKYIGETRCDAEFRNKQKKHLVSTNRGEGTLLNMDRKKQTYLPNGQLLKNNQFSEREVEKQMGKKIRVTSARNGIPYMQGGDKSYPSPEYSPGFYKDYSVPSDASWAAGVAREARADPTKHASGSTKPPPQRMTWTLRKALETFEGELDDVKALDDWKPPEPKAVAEEEA